MSTPTPNRACALKRLSGFVERAGLDYAKLRNFDLGSDQFTHVSRLSPYIRHRLLLEQEVLRAVLRRHGHTSADKFVQEIFWRAYFKGWLEQHPKVWTDYRVAVQELSETIQRDTLLSQRYSTATAGDTGIECFDEWVHELVRTGYLHNHARMWFTSIWVFTLDLPWQLGADFFYRHLLDGDPASNTLGWRWVCGLHTKGKTYLARASNIERFTGARFHPQEQLATRAEALNEVSNPPRVAAPDFGPPATTEPYALLVTTEDCHPESLPLDTPPTAIVGMAAARDRSPLPVSSAVQTFSEGAVCDALNRAHERFARPAETLKARDWGESLAAWCKKSGLGSIRTAYAPVGPVAERLTLTQAQLRDEGIELSQVMRNYDRRVWPHTASGFFKLKKRIPELIEELSLG